VLLAGGVLAAGCGSEGDTAATKGRLVEVVMTEMAFTPSSLTVAEGERITFRFVNNGNVVHEAVLGDADYQREHEAVMNAPTTTAKGSDHGAHTHDASNAVTVGPGATMELTWTAPERGTVQIGCHQPGHYAAGMKAELQVG
jgi:uncharacterized cupredoxin-like copper-binding protein